MSTHEPRPNEVLDALRILLAAVQSENFNRTGRASMSVNLRAAITLAENALAAAGVGGGAK